MQPELRPKTPLALAPARDRRVLERVIAGLPVFRPLSRADLGVLASQARLREARRGAVIVQRAERMPGLVALAYGTAKLALRRAGGQEKVVRLIGPGESFGLAAALLDRPCPIDLVALTDCLLATIPPVPLLRLLENNGGFARCVARLLAERTLELLGELEASAQHSGLQRLACYLDSLAAPAGPPGAWIVRLPATKTTVAARLGVKKETLSRMLRQLTTRGLIAVAGREVAILDRAGLARLTGAAS
jgi:CRP-like cAMP-binding protein